MPTSKVLRWLQSKGSESSTKNGRVEDEEERFGSREDCDNSVGNNDNNITWPNNQPLRRLIRHLARYLDANDDEEDGVGEDLVVVVEKPQKKGGVGKGRKKKRKWSVESKKSVVEGRKKINKKNNDQRSTILSTSSLATFEDLISVCLSSPVQLGTSTTTDNNGTRID